MLLTFAPERRFGAKTLVRTVCGARKSFINRASKNVHYSRGIRSVKLFSKAANATIVSQLRVAKAAGVAAGLQGLSRIRQKKVIDRPLVFC
jgi:hypothetical protein